MRSLPIFVTSSFLLTFGLLASSASAQTINNNLTLGSKGVEVTLLQQFLVSEGYFVMPQGVSYGYFGPLTKKAVANWQSVNGVLPAVGFFGPISRSVFNAKSSTSETVIPSYVDLPATIPVSLPSSPPVSNTVQPDYDSPHALGHMPSRISLFRASPFEVKAGDIVSLDGSGFSKTLNKVYFNGSNSIIATSTNGSVMDVVIPSLSNGEFELSVENVFGSSANPDIKIKIKVTDNPQSPPNIESGSISGDTVTLLGSGFTSSNIIYTTFGDSPSPVSSNGTMLTFGLSSLSRFNQIKQFTLGKYQASLFIFIQNEHGMNKEPFKLDINI